MSYNIFRRKTDGLFLPKPSSNPHSPHCHILGLGHPSIKVTIVRLRFSSWSLLFKLGEINELEADFPQEIIEILLFALKCETCKLDYTCAGLWSENQDCTQTAVQQSLEKWLKQWRESLISCGGSWPHVSSSETLLSVDWYLSRVSSYRLPLIISKVQSVGQCILVQVFYKSHSLTSCHLCVFLWQRPHCISSNQPAEHS